MKTVTLDPTAGHTVAEVAPVLLAVLSHRQARLFVDGEAGLTEIHGVRSARMRGSRYHTIRGNAPGRGEKRFHGARLEETKRHYERAAAELDAALTREHAIGVILLGEHHTVAEFLGALPVRLAARVLRTMPMDLKAIRRRAMREMAEEARHFVPVTEEC